MLRRKISIVVVISGLLLVLVASSLVWAEEKKLVVWGWDYRATKDIAPQIEEFEKAYPDVKIEAVDLGAEDLHNKLLASLLAGTGAPDVSFEVDIYARKYYGTPMILPLSDVYPNYKEEFVQGLSYRWEYNGELWGIPYDTGPFIVFYRKDVFDELGVEFPDNWQDFLEVGKKVTKPGERYMGFFYQADQFAAIVQSRGGMVTSIQDEVLFNNPIAVETLEFIRSLVKEYQITEYASPWDPAGFEKVKTGRWVSLPIWFWYQSFGLKDVAYNPEFDGKWRVAPTLRWTKNDPPTGADFTCGGLWVVTSQTKYPDIAKKFAASLGTKEAQVSQATRRGIMPVNVLALQELSSWQDPFFGNQETFKIALEVMKQYPPSIEFGGKWPAISPILTSAIEKVIFEDVPPDKALADAEKQAKIELAE